MRKILADGRIVARDQNKVFVERADRRPMSPKDAQIKYDLARGKGNAFVEFDADEDEVATQYNQRLKS